MLQNPYIINEKQCFTSLLYATAPLVFTKKCWRPPSMIFQKPQINILYYTASTNGRFLKNLSNANSIPVISYHANLVSKYLNVSVKQEIIKIQLLVPHSLKNQRKNLSLLPLTSIYPFTPFIIHKSPFKINNTRYLIFHVINNRKKVIH